MYPNITRVKNSDDFRLNGQKLAVIDQHESITLLNSDTYQFVGTYGLLECVNMTIYAPPHEGQKSAVIMAHFDVYTNVEETMDALALERFDHRPVTTSLLSHAGNEQLANTIRYHLQDYGIIPFEHTKNGPSDVIISMRDGTLRGGYLDGNAEPTCDKFRDFLEQHADKNRAEALLKTLCRTATTPLASYNAHEGLQRTHANPEPVFQFTL